MIEVSVFFSVIKCGGVPAGEGAFALDSVLLEVFFSGAQFVYASILASPAGMTVGGSARWPIPPSREILKPSVSSFGLPYRLEFCSSLIGKRHRSAKINELVTSGLVSLEDDGTFCGLEIVSPGEWLKPYVTLKHYVTAPSGARQAGEEVGLTKHDEIRIVIPSDVALGIIHPVRVIVRTSRGVRLLDLGIPLAAIIDANGNVTNGAVFYIDDCLYLPVGPEDPHGISWGDPRDLLVNPVDWLDYVEALHGLDVQLVTLFDLEPGELIQFRSRDHSIDVTADRNGQALVPVLLPLADQTGSAMLTRVNRQGIEGHFSVDSVVFQRQASLPAGLRSRLASGINGTARLTTEFEERIAVHEIGASGAVTLVANQQLSASSEQLSGSANQLSGSGYEVSRSVDQVSYLKRASSHSRDRCGDLPGVIALHPVPGFGEAPVAIAEMKDGAVLVLELNEEGARVAGTFTGPIGEVEVSDDWGLIAGRDQATIYRVRRSQPEQPRLTHGHPQNRQESEPRPVQHSLKESAGEWGISFPAAYRVIKRGTHDGRREPARYRGRVCAFVTIIDNTLLRQ